MPRLIQLDTDGRSTAAPTIDTSAGAADAGKVPETDADGLLDMSFIDATVASAGAGDSGKAVLLNGSGQLDPTVMPTGVGADTASVLASENLAAGDIVNIYNNAGTPNVRKADATAEGKEASGFVLAAVTSGNNATVYFEGRNTQLAGLTPGARLYLSTTPGAVTATAPTTTGNVVQRVGYAITATSADFEAAEPITLA